MVQQAIQKDLGRVRDALFRATSIDVALSEVGPLPPEELNAVFRQELAALNEAVVNMFRAVERLAPGGQ